MSSDKKQDSVHTLCYCKGGALTWDLQGSYIINTDESSSIADGTRCLGALCTDFLPKEIITLEISV